MTITINTAVLKRHGLSLGEFLVMLLAYFEIDYQKSYENVIRKSIGQKNLFRNMSTVLSDNSKNLVTRILLESNERVIRSGIDFDDLALALQQCYPEGNRPGTTYSWRGSTEEIAQKLRTLVAEHNFIFTYEEALSAVQSYVSQFEKPYENMRLLKYLILKTSKGHTDIDSLFMTIIENNRQT